MVVDSEVTRRPDGHSGARAIHIPGVVIEATSRDAALEQIRTVLVARQRTGVEIVQLDIGDIPGPPPVPWPPRSGAFPDDEAYREMLAEIDRYRRELDQGAAYCLSLIPIMSYGSSYHIRLVGHVPFTIPLGNSR